MPGAFFVHGTQKKLNSNKPIMQHNFDTIYEAFKEAGVDNKKTEFSITNYSLNTKLSFKFNNVNELLLFLNLSAHDDSIRIKEINAMIIEAGVDPKAFFYVNFFKTKIAEL